MRLTKKYKEDYFINPHNKKLTKLDIENDNNSSQIIRNKLGQLEDIEDELGIDLITLFKALKEENIFVKDSWGNVYTCKPKWNLYLNDYGCWCFECFGGLCGIELKDYGKTWALTKEELK